MQLLHQSKKIDWKKVTFLFLFITLLASIAYTIYKIAVSSPDAIGNEVHVKVKSDYVLMLIQCLLGLVVMMIPSIIEKRMSIDIPNNMEILYFIFLFCAIYLGEVRNFYYLVPHWDTILHAFSGAMIGAMGFTLVSFFNETSHIDMKLSPFFVALFAFCFALSAGAIWEIYEYLCDGLLSLNMQKFMLADGTLLAGHVALRDTMKDIIVDALAALAISIIGYFSIKAKLQDKNK